MRILGLDVGEKRIGVARADSSTRIAVPVGTVLVDGSEWLKIAQIARVQSTQFFVIGLPRSNEGAETAQSAYVRQFAKTLTEKIPGAKIRFQDESLTSVMAEERLKKERAKKGKKFDKGKIDTEAATIILQDFLEGLGTETSPVTEMSESGAVQNVANLAKKEGKKVKLNAKKATHKMKKATKWMTGVAIVLIIGLIGTGVAMMYRDKVRAEREEEYKRLEEEMEPEVFSFTIKPGETIFDVKTHLRDVGYSETEVEEAMSADYDFMFLAERPAGASLEGFLYGETYEFYKSDSAKTVIEKFLSGMERIILENDLRGAYEEQGLSLYEGVTLASVVQKEAKSPDQPEVARVFYNRLSAGMGLGSDVTVSYALDLIDPERVTYTNNEAALSVDSCYNTRLYGGLPCGPISNPGLSALLAVAHPGDSDYLYFLTGDDGMMYYSSTWEGHVQNMSHCAELCSVSL